MSCYNFNLPIEEFQNCKNKMVAARSHTFFASKVHKLKKMLRPLLWKQKSPVQEQQQTPEDIQNAINEALEARLNGDLIDSAGVRGDAIKTIVDGSITLVAVTPGSPVPVHFVCPAPGMFSWTFLPAADNDFCNDVDSMTLYQVPERQSPVAVVN